MASLRETPEQQWAERGPVSPACLDDVPLVSAAAHKSPAPTLCVDLDGTLVRTDLLFESLARLMKQKPWLLCLVPIWVLRGKAYLKQQLARNIHFDPSFLPYNWDVINWLRREKARGRELFLTTAADEILANSVALHLGVFDRVLASDGRQNLKGKQKLERIRSEISGEFEYVADSSADLEIWRASSGAILVNSTPSLVGRVRRDVEVSRTFTAPGGRLAQCARALRIHQWSKNALIFVPLITSHQIFHGALLLKAALGALLFSLCASAQYMLNDLLDLEADRQHETKAERPFASGSLPLQLGFAAIFILLAMSLGAAFMVSALFAGLLVVYFLASLTYSFYVKRLLLLDVFMLSGLYIFRIIVGHLVTNVPFSVWLLAFSLFVFLSLAFNKRLVELNTSGGKFQVAGRSYRADDVLQVNLFGVCSAFLAAVVFMLYLQSENVRQLYRWPEPLWLLSPVFLYWISRIWLLSHRGEIKEEPLLFVLKDRATYVVGIVAGFIMFAASHGWEGLH